MALIYFELRTTNLCNEWQGRNDTLSYNVKRIRLLGRGIPFSLIVMFGWSEFRRHYYSTILVGQLVGLLNTFYISILFIYGIDDDGTIGIYFVPAYIMFAVAVLWQCLIVMVTFSKIIQQYPIHGGIFLWFFEWRIWLPMRWVCFINTQLLCGSIL